MKNKKKTNAPDEELGLNKDPKNPPVEGHSGDFGIVVETKNDDEKKEPKKPKKIKLLKKVQKFTGVADDEKNLEEVKVKKIKGVQWVTREMADVLGREYMLLTTLKDTIYFTIFLIISTVINLGFADSSMFHLYQVINQQMLTLNNFQGVNTASDFWAFLNRAFTKSFYWDYWYYPDDPIKMTNKYDRNIFYENKLLGVPRLRQLKVRNDSCPIHSVFKRIFLSCYGRFNLNNEDKEPFGLGEGTAWTHHTDSELDATSFWGKIDWYPGSGYYQDLFLTKKETMEAIHTLKHNLWLTRGTRAIFLDFSVYNSNTNLFCVVTAGFEFPPTGGVITTPRIHIIQLLRYSQPYDYFILTLELIYICYIVYYLMEEIREIIYFKWAYLKMFWSYIDLSICMMGFVSLCLGVTRTIIVDKQVKKIVDHPNKFANLDLASTLQMYYRNLLAIQLFLIYLKVFKYLNFNKSMAQLNNTLARCRKDMMGFALMFFVIFVAFAILGFLIFGTEVADFSTFFLAMFTLLRTILGDFDYTEIEKANRVLAPIFFLCFIFLVFFVLLNMFLAIINDTYTDVKTEIAIAPEELRMTGFLKRGFYNVLILMGLKRCIKTVTLQKNEYQMTTNEIKTALKKIGFSDLEIEMFFSRYNIDPNAEVKDYDIQKLIDALEGKIDPSPPKFEKKLRTDDDKPLVAIDDFIKQQEKLDEIEESLVKATSALNTLLTRLENLENVRKIKIPD